jgi:hypothetical protein
MHENFDKDSLSSLKLSKECVNPEMNSMPGTLILNIIVKDRDLSDRPPESPDHPINWQRQQNEWKMSYLPLRDIAHMST